MLINPNQIRMSSSPRSGGTFIYQILEMLTQGKIVRSHEYKKNRNVIIFRDFLDSAISYYRVMNDLYDDFYINDKDVLDKIINNYIPYTSNIVKYVNDGCYRLYLVYEYDIKTKEGNNYDTIFQKIGQFFNIKIPNTLRESIISETNININKKRSKKYETFHKWDDRNLIHGKHVHTGDVGIWKNHVSNQLHEYYENSLLNKNHKYCLNKIL